MVFFFKIEVEKVIVSCRYFERADGHYRLGLWVVFWRGKIDYGDLDRYIQAAGRVSPSFS